MKTHILCSLLLLFSVLSMANTPLILRFEVGASSEFILPVEGAYKLNWHLEKDPTIQGSEFIQLNSVLEMQSITLPQKGTYIFIFDDGIERIWFPESYPESENLLTVLAWGNTKWSTMEEAFYKCSNVQIIASDQPNLSKVENMKKMFYGATKFQGSIASWDVSSVVNMSFLFSKAISFNEDISSWDVSNVKDMSGMFEETQFNQPLNSWNVSNVENMNFTFSKSSYNKPLNDWNVSNVIVMHAMFRYSKFEQEILEWDVSNVILMGLMFQFAPFNEKLNSWDVSKVTDMHAMFAFSAFNQDLDDWDVSNVRTMRSMFKLSTFNKPIGNWDVRNVTDMGLMFFESVYNHPLNQWDVRSVTQMDRMFYESEFDQDLSEWEPISLTNGFYMFSNSNLSSLNYTNLLNTWATNSLKQNVLFHDQDNMIYCDDYGRNILINQFDWNIDGDRMGTTQECNSAIVIREENPIMNHKFSNSKLNVYPNPTDGLINFSSEELGIIKIVDLNGRIIWQSSLEDTNSVNLNHAVPGIYILQFTSEDGNIKSKKLILN